MTPSPLEPNPVAAFLLHLAELKATGVVEVGGRRVSINKGEVVDVGPAPGDESLGEFLLNSARIDTNDLNRAYNDFETQNANLDTSLKALGIMSESDMAEARLALWLDRMVRGLRVMRYDRIELPTLERCSPIPAGFGSIPLPVLVLEPA